RPAAPELFLGDLLGADHRRVELLGDARIAAVEDLVGDNGEDLVVLDEPDTRRSRLLGRADAELAVHERHVPAVDRENVLAVPAIEDGGELLVDGAVVDGGPEELDRPDIGDRDADPDVV